MSVINRVLHQLEQRGAHPAEQEMVRAVPQAGRRSAMPLLALGAALVAGVAAWQWMQARKLDAATESPAQRQSAAPVAAPASGALAGKPQAEMLAPDPQPDAGSGTPPPALVGEKTVLASSPAPSAPPRQARDRLRQYPKALPKELAPPAEPQPAQPASPDAQAAAQTPGDEPPVKQVSPAQYADAEFRKAVALMQQGRITDAMAGYEAALRLDAGHDAARQAWVVLLLEAKRGADAERVLQEGLKGKPEHIGFAMLLARLQVERGAVGQATETLEKLLPYAGSQADFQAFLAALLQRQNRHDEAINHYRIALQLAPHNGVWLTGYGISLQAAQRAGDAREAFRRALDSKTLSPELQSFVRMKIKEL